MSRQPYTFAIPSSSQVTTVAHFGDARPQQGDALLCRRAPPRRPGVTPSPRFRLPAARSHNSCTHSVSPTFQSHVWHAFWRRATRWLQRTHSETGTEAHRHTDKETPRGTDTQTLALAHGHTLAHALAHAAVHALAQARTRVHAGTRTRTPAHPHTRTHGHTHRRTQHSRGARARARARARGSAHPPRLLPLSPAGGPAAFVLPCVRAHHARQLLLPRPTLLEDQEQRSAVSVQMPGP